MDRQKQESTKVHMAYFRVHSLATVSYLALSVLYIRAISGTNGSSGFGSVSNEHIDKRTLEIVRAGLHCDRKISRQILPLLFMFG